MPNQDLLKYIQDSLALNVTKVEIKRAVLEVGWAEQDVALAFFVAEGGVVPVAKLEPAPVFHPEPAPIIQQIPQYSAPSFAQPASVSPQPINFASNIESKSMPMATMPAHTPREMPSEASSSQPISMAHPSPHHGTLLWVMGTTIVALLVAGGIAIWVVMNNKGEVVVQKAGENVVLDAGAVSENQLKVDSSLTTTKTQVINDTSKQNGITMNVAIKSEVTTTTSCGTEGCFQQKFSACQPATLEADAGFASVYYKIVAPIDSQHCRMMFKYTKNPNPDWVNKEMTCTFLNKMSTGFEEQMGNKLAVVMSSGGGLSDYCEGSLYSLLQPAKAVTRLPSNIKISNLNYTEISVAKLNDYVGKSITFKVDNGEAGMKFCVGTLTVYKSGKTEASDELTDHKCSESPFLSNLIYNEKMRVVSIPLFGAAVVSDIVRGFNDSKGINQLVFVFYLKDVGGKETNHLKLTVASSGVAKNTSPAPVIASTSSLSPPSTPVNNCAVTTATNPRQIIEFPSQGATLIAGQTYTTTWLDEKYNSPVSYPVFLSTVPNNDPLYDLGLAYKAQCKFTFTIPNSAVYGTNYRLMFSRNGIDSIYSAVFAISK